MKLCHIFEVRDPQSIPRTFHYDVIEDYGDWCNGHFLHTWDDGKRMLVRCKTCGAYVLVQQSEFHSFTDALDSHYMTYVAVSGPEEAHELNSKYSGFELERDYNGKCIMAAL